MEVASKADANVSITTRARNGHSHAQTSDAHLLLARNLVGISFTLNSSYSQLLSSGSAPRLHLQYDISYTPNF